MRRKAAIVVALVGLVLAAMLGASGTSAAPERSTATNLTIWVGWSARELSEFKKVVAEYDQKNADVTVKVVGAINDDKITKDGTLAVTAADAKVEYSIDAGGTWTSSFAAVEGVNTVQVRQTDVVGNVLDLRQLIVVGKDHRVAFSGQRPHLLAPVAR